MPLHTYNSVVVQRQVCISIKVENIFGQLIHHHALPMPSRSSRALHDPGALHNPTLKSAPIAILLCHSLSSFSLLMPIPSQCHKQRTDGQCQNGNKQALRGWAEGKETRKKRQLTKWKPTYRFRGPDSDAALGISRGTTKRQGMTLWRCCGRL